MPTKRCPVRFLALLNSLLYTTPLYELYCTVRLFFCLFFRPSKVSFRTDHLKLVYSKAKAEQARKEFAEGAERVLVNGRFLPGSTVNGLQISYRTVLAERVMGN